MFNGIGDPSNAVKASNKPPELRPLLNINNGGKDGDCPSYISRSSVEKILSQQKKVRSNVIESHLILFIRVELALGSVIAVSF